MKKTSFSLLLATCVFAASTQAGMQLYMPTGQATTVSGLSNPKLESSGRFNPASIYENTNRVRIGFGDFNLHARVYGLGTANDSMDELSDEIDHLDEVIDAYDEGNRPATDVLEAINDFEAVLDREIKNVSEDFKLTLGTSTNLPIVSSQFRLPQVDGAFGVGVSYMAMSRLSFLYSPFSFNVDLDVIQNSDDLEPTDFLVSATSLYKKTGHAWNFDIAYAQPVPNMRIRNTVPVVGARANLIGAHLNKQLYPFNRMLREAVADDGDIDIYVDMIEEDLREGAYDGELQYVIALDLGIVYSNERGHLGFTGYNLNAPELEYNVIGFNCNEYTEPARRDACFYADLFTSRGDIQSHETHVLSPHYTVDGSLRLLGNRVVLGAHYDVTTRTDLFGDKSQQLAGSLLVQPEHWVIPRFRFGVIKDFEDPDPITVGLGLSLFDFIHFDQSFTADWSALLDGDDSEALNGIRGFNTSLSMSLAF